jgi:hypothetical protein
LLKVAAVVTRPLQNRSWFVRLTLGLTLYLLLFSAFALYHAYANNELIDSHGCQIGEWVQHAQITVFSVVLASAILAPVLYLAPAARRVHPAPRYASASLRGPPRMALL